ncbi:MAG: vitamin B12-dependent ribonucleotide reductase [Vicinamibacteria bacterium]|nr:vitamin B12-dependent ribonucleotide reductase [Vicinamibacteria bacterium]
MATQPPIVPAESPARSENRADSRIEPRPEKRSKGMSFKRVFTTDRVHPFDDIEWDLRGAVINDERGRPVFEQKNVEAPKSWSQTATNIVASKYFRGAMGSPERETSVKQLVGRVVETIAGWALKQNYFDTSEDLAAFKDDLTFLLVRQYAAFNSPVWFNVGIEPHPQASACFINSVADTMDSILGLARTEGMLFKYGSGTGSNLSSIRSSKENLAGGGTASGPVSFMRGYDAFAGVIKSGGKTRRAAKMVILNTDHPDIEEFITSKSEEERKAWALIEAGYAGGFNVKGGAYDSVFFQNANHSVRATDGFMRAVVEDKEWTTHFVRDGALAETKRARDLMSLMAESAWQCGDPGMQFDTTINDWHTCPNTARINASNPCSEYMFLDDTACNLASLNLMKFVREDGEFDPASFRAACRTLITAQEILVDNASYPTPSIERNSHDYRPLGLGYANLGVLLMDRGLAYDSDTGRAYAAAVTALMHGEAYAQSARVAASMGPFAGYATNAEPMLRIIEKHRQHAHMIDASIVPRPLMRAALEVWDEAYTLGAQHGYRNSQVTVLAPTGTIGFMMDCDTTGIEPDIALVKYKKLVGGGMIKIVNQSVPVVLRRLGYNPAQVQDILKYIDEKETIEGAPNLKEEHLEVFDCAFPPANGKRSIHYMGHIKMMAAVQPFLSGAISKTVNMPTDSTPEEIAKAYVESWRLGLKAVAVYRDGCKRSQPLSTSMPSSKEDKASDPQVVAVPGIGVVEGRPVRRKLPDERQAITHKFSIAGHEGYITVGMYEDGKPGEVFLVMAKEGSTVSGLMDGFATSLSLALQYGVPLEAIVDKFSHTRYEPSGFTKNPDIGYAKSITDYIARWLAVKFLGRTRENEGEPALSPATTSETPRPTPVPLAAKPAATPSVSSPNAQAMVAFKVQADAPPCHECGSLMVRNGACYRCANCGATSGCS